MTDMKISDGALDAGMRHVTREILLRDSTEAIQKLWIAGALTYYAAHPDELPEGFSYARPYEDGEAVDYFCNKCGSGSGTFERGGVKHDGCSYYGSPLRRTT